MPPVARWAWIAAGGLVACNLLTDFDTGFAPAPTGDGGGDGDADGDADGDGDGDGDADGDADAPPCELIGGPSPIEDAPFALHPAVSRFEDDLAVAYVDGAQWEEEVGLARVVLGSCEGLDGPSIDIEEDDSQPDSRVDAAWNDEQGALGVVWNSALNRHLLEWNRVEQDGDTLRTGSHRVMQPGYFADQVYDLRWARISVTGGEWLILMNDAVDAEYRTTVVRFPEDPWPPNMARDVVAWEAAALAGSGDIAGFAGSATYAFTASLLPQLSLEAAAIFIDSEELRGSTPLLQGVEQSRIGAIDDDVLPEAWVDAGATATAVVASVSGLGLSLGYPDVSLDRVPIDGSQNVLAFDVAASGSTLVVAWIENTGPTAEVRVATAELRDGAIVRQSPAMFLAGPMTARGGGLSVATSADGTYTAIAWSEPDDADLPRARLACVRCVP